MVFQPGQSGNPGGKRREKPFRDALMLEITDAEGDNRRLRRIARKLLKEAESGNMSAIGMLLDRIDGKVPQTISGDDDAPPVRIEAVRRILIDPLIEQTAERIEPQPSEAVAQLVDETMVDGTEREAMAIQRERLEEADNECEPKPST